MTLSKLLLRGENEAKDESVGILMVLLDFFSSTYFPLALFEINCSGDPKSSPT